VLGRLRGGVSGVGRGLAAFGSGFVDTFLRENRVLPPVLALLALLVFAWVVAGIFVGGPDEERQALNEANLAQSEDAPGSDPLAPEVENRNVESYAAYQSKDPFRQLLASPEDTTTATTPETTTEDTAGETTTGPGPGGGGGGLDTDGDGLSDRRESELGLDPFNPDTDADGIPDGDENAGGSGGRGGGGGGAGGGGDGGLFDSGGDLRLP
jgi:Bacterial TSP3 repeat